MPLCILLPLSLSRLLLSSSASLPLAGKHYHLIMALARTLLCPVLLSLLVSIGNVHCMLSYCIFFHCQLLSSSLHMLVWAMDKEVLDQSNPATLLQDGHMRTDYAAVGQRLMACQHSLTMLEGHQDCPAQLHEEAQMEGSAAQPYEEGQGEGSAAQPLPRLVGSAVHAFHPVHDTMGLQPIPQVVGSVVQPSPSPAYVQGTAAMQQHTGERQQCRIKCLSNAHPLPTQPGR